MGPVSRYAPPLAVMALIFALSATPDLSSGLGTWDFVLRKLAHVTIFALLWLDARPRDATGAARSSPPPSPSLYAVSDELHQSFVEGRHGTPVDVAIDASGSAWRRSPGRSRRARRGRPGPPWPLRGYSQPRSVAIRTACARSTAPSLP